MRILRLVSLAMFAALAIIGGIISYHAFKGVDLGFLLIVTSPNAALSLFLFATGSLNSLKTWIFGWGLLAPALLNLWLLYGLMLYVLSAPENLSTGLGGFMLIYAFPFVFIILFIFGGGVGGIIWNLKNNRRE
jgi:hypothetical protein